MGSTSNHIPSESTEMLKDEIDAKIYDRAMKEHKENPQDISFEKMMVELGLDRHNL